MVIEEQEEQQEEEQQYALCLNMIVKNESHIIKDTLIKLLQKVKFDYWVISDTGSTDETRKIITDFFKEVGIPGELYQDAWVDFAHNRNKALQHAFGKSKYLLVFDADDEICGDFVLPELTKDSYSLQFGSYTRTQIVNNYKRWKYVGVLHEYICPDDSRIDDASAEIIKGPYHVISGRTGNRNLDSNKYLKDAIVLEKAYRDAVDAKDNIYIRYGFYCANSYYDCEKYESAILWYKKTLENGGWVQEKYVSCLRLYNCYNNLGNKEAGFFYLVKSAEYDRERAECYYELIKYYSGSGLHDVAYGYYGVLRDFYNKSYLKTGLNNKLFVDVSVSDFLLPYYVVIISDKMRDYETGIHMYRIVFTKKCKIFNEWFIGNLLYNLQFFIEHVEDEDKPAFYLLFQEYIDFLLANNYPISNHHDTMHKYRKYGITTSKWKAINEECSTSKKILIYTGFHNKLWNYTNISSMGGSEKAVAYLAEKFPKEYEIIISGDVEDEVVGNVTYVNRFKLQALLDLEKFHTIIVSRYVSFFLLFPRFKCYQLYLSAHDTSFVNNIGNSNISANSLVEENNKYITGVICSTTWHKSCIIKEHPCLKYKIKVINNGLVLSPDGYGGGAATSLSHSKIKNKFVWTSCSYRGLDLLLKLWDKILEVMPDATLDISSYLPFPMPNTVDEEIMLIINHHSDSIKHHGILNAEELYGLMSKAEYWLYTCTFCEASCITALEMIMNEVVCLYYPLAGLNDTIGEYGIKVNYGDEIQSIMNLSEERKVEMRINGKKYAMSCSWENRAKEWASVLGLGFSEVKKNISNLFDATKIENIFLRNKTINYIKTDSCIGFVLKAGYYWEEWMFKYIQENYLENTNMIDLGGNIGTTTLLMSEVLSDNCNVFTFEPVYHDILFKNILDNNLNNKVVIYPYGVGNEIKSLKIKPVNLSDNINFGALELMVNLVENDCDSLKINIVPLDYFNFENVSLIKIDVENMDIQVLEGCINLIKKCKPTIIIECHQLNTLKQTSIFKKLLNIGYEISRIPEGANDFIMKVNLNGAPKSKFKILNLILFSNENISRFKESYLKMIQIQKEYIKSYSGNNITFYFYCYKEDLEEEYIIEDNIIYIKGVESYVPGILQKTMKAFEITKNMEYDFLLRSNISTVIDYSKLNEVLHEIPDNVIYAGGTCQILTWLDHDYGVHKIYNIPYIFGTSIILNKEGVDKLIENKFLLDETIIDDVAFGIFFDSFGDKPYGFDSYYRYNLDCMTNDVIFYRNRVSYGTEVVDRTIEIDNMTNVIQQIMEREQQ